MVCFGSLQATTEKQDTINDQRCPFTVSCGMCLLFLFEQSNWIVAVLVLKFPSCHGFLLHVGHSYSWKYTSGAVIVVALLWSSLRSHKYISVCISTVTTHVWCNNKKWVSIVWHIIGNCCLRFSAELERTHNDSTYKISIWSLTPSSVTQKVLCGPFSTACCKPSTVSEFQVIWSRASRYCWVEPQKAPPIWVICCL